MRFIVIPAILLLLVAFGAVSILTVRLGFLVMGGAAIFWAISRLANMGYRNQNVNSYGRRPCPGPVARAPLPAAAQPRVMEARAREVRPIRHRESSGFVWLPLVFGLVLFGLVGTGWRHVAEQRLPAAVATPGGRSQIAPQGVQGISDQRWSWNVLGRGKTTEDARQEALEEARAKLIQFLRSEDPPLEWTPSLAYVARLVRGEPEDEVRDFDSPVGRMHQVRLHLEVNPDTRLDMVRQDRHFRTEQRQTFLGKILAGLVAMLVAVTGYVRLDEWSKGYYSGWLRLAAASIIGAAGAGLWLLIGH